MSEIKLDIPNITVLVDKGDQYRVVVNNAGSVVRNITGSYITAANTALTSSYALTASYAANATVDTSSLLTTSSFNTYTGSNTSTFSGTSSLALTASYALNGGGGGGGAMSGSTNIALYKDTFIGDGVTKDFALTHDYIDIDQLVVSVGGLLQTSNVDYTYNTNSDIISFIFAPPSQSNVLIRGFVGLLQTPALILDQYSFVGDGIIKDYILSQSYTTSSFVVSVGGLSQTYTVDYTFDSLSNTLSFVSTPPSQSNVAITAFINSTSGSVGSITGSLLGNATTATTASYAIKATVIPDAAPDAPVLGSIYFDNNFIYVYTGVGYKSASLN